MMGLTSSEWVYAVDDYYYQGDLLDITQLPHLVYKQFFRVVVCYFLSFLYIA